MYANVVKRILDILISFTLLPFVLLLTIPIGILIKSEDGGSVFYCGERYGRKMRKFRMFKFRTMKMNAPDIRNIDGTTYNSVKDSRLTKIGSFLRKTSLDELPQLFNVLIGDMSLLGPRPSPLGNEKTYNEFILRKFEVRPGITGYNQAVKRNSATLRERYRNDIYYVDNISFRFDLYICYLTVKTVLLRKNIYSR